MILLEYFVPTIFKLFKSPAQFSLGFFYWLMLFKTIIENIILLENFNKSTYR